MEDFLNQLNETKTCYDNYKYDDLKNKSQAQLNELCFDQRKVLLTTLFSGKLSTTNIVKDRIALIEERKKEQIVERRKFLDA